MADLIASTRDQIERRLEHLRPLAAEADRLERALEVLRGIDPDGAAAPAQPAARRRPAVRRRGAPRGRRAGATRANDFLRIVRASGGTSIADAAARMGTSPNYLYRIAATLQGEGLVAKRGRLWVAAEAGGGPQAEPERAGSGDGAEASQPESAAPVEWAADDDLGADALAETPAPVAPVEALPDVAFAVAEAQVDRPAADSAGPAPGSGAGVEPLADPVGDPALPVGIEPVPSPESPGEASGHDPSPTAVPPPTDDVDDDDASDQDEEGGAAAWPAPPPSPFAEGR